MKNKKVMDILLAASVIGTQEYGFDLIEDPKVSDCVTYMYLWMMSTGNHSPEKVDECYEKFTSRFNELNPAQQEIVKAKYTEVVESSTQNGTSTARG